MDIVTTVTCHIRGESYNTAFMVDAMPDDIESAKEEAKSEAISAFTDGDGDLAEPYRLWFTVASYPDQKRVETTITAELPPIPDEAPVTATVS
jgi:hypothetical protein